MINASHVHGFGVYYWREGKYEVDFVLEHRGEIVGIEVKSGNTQPKPGMPEFNKKVHPNRTLLVGKEGIPWQDFLQISPDSLF